MPSVTVPETKQDAVAATAERDQFVVGVREVRTGVASVNGEVVATMDVPGTGIARGVSVVWALHAAGGTPYLVQQYRFAGTVHLSRVGVRAWSSLVPAMAVHP